MLQIIKRDGSKVDFNEEKIINAVLAAFEEVYMYFFSILSH